MSSIFTINKISANIYLDVLILLIAPELEEFQPWIIYQQDGAPRHWSSVVCQFLNEKSPGRWIGSDGPPP